MSTSPPTNGPAETGSNGEARISIRGARAHNLKNIDLDIPRNQLIVFTGPSGSGKSSLAFDTLFAEGQRQFIESLSVYARQFLHQMERPDVDLIEGLQPTLCIDQRPGNQNPRSTVATVTEIYDYLRLMMARLGEPHCPECGERIQQQSCEQIQERLLELPEGTKAMIMAPLVRGRRGQHKEVFQQIRKAGLVRARVNGEVHEVEQAPELDPRRLHHIEAVVDRVILRPGIDARLAESVQLAIRLGGGMMCVCYHSEAPGSPDGRNGWQDELYSTVYACPRCNVSFEELEPRTFSFNSPYGACPACDGLGIREEFDPELALRTEVSCADGAILPWKNLSTAQANKRQSELDKFFTAHQLDPQTPLQHFPAAVLERLWRGQAKPKFLGLQLLLEKEFATATNPKRLEQLASFRSEVTCRECQGSRLRREARSVTLDGRTIHDVTQLSVKRALEFFQQLRFPARHRPIAEPLLAEIRRRLEFLLKVGVDYLTLDRSADTLSGGELQRVRLATSIGSGLVGVCYVLDEPSIGLHQRDNQRLINALRDLQQQGNTVIVVEHDEATMREADRIVDLGPGAGHEGGRVLAEGSPAEISRHEDSVTGGYLSGRIQIPVPAKRRRAVKSRSIVLEGASMNNLKLIDVLFPLGCLVCVTGVSGSGKSSLVNETLARALIRRLGGLAPKPGAFKSLRGVSQIDKVIPIDQSPIGRTPRSNAATFTGLFDEVRRVFANTRDAKQRGFRASRFSFNAPSGRCEACQGHGVKKLEMNFLPDLFVTCNECNGERFNRQTLQVHYRGQSIAQVLDMAVGEALGFFENFDSIHRTLQCLADVGLGYLPLGQPSTTLSGGEAQRIKLAAQLARVDTGKTLYLLDEPTTGLHFDDIRRLLEVLGRLVDRGNTVIVIEHNLDVIKCADWIIDLGPEGGEAGGQLLTSGTPEEVAQHSASHTGRFLRAFLPSEPHAL